MNSRTMLTFFPTPYPNEWWYSVLCRYYVRSGWSLSAGALYELYGKRELSLTSLFPNIGCGVVVGKIPSGIFDLKKILLKYTLLPYYLRFFTADKKKKMLNDLLSGINRSGFRTQEFDKKQKLKFCPLCYREDTEIYGESYWHREHQIPLASICLKHQKKLCWVETPVRRASGQFLPLSRIENISENRSGAFPEWENPLNEFLVSMLTMPFELSPPEEYNNLINVLWSKGFGCHTAGSQKSLVAEKLRQQCVLFYGNEISEKYFADLSTYALRNICIWKTYRELELYALLSVFAGLSLKELFGPEIHPVDPTVSKLLKYRESGIVYRKGELVQRLGISSHGLDSLADRYDIKPFWTERTTSRPEFLYIPLSNEEKEKLTIAAAVCGNAPISTFVRAILLQESNRILNNQNKEAQYEL